MNTSIASAAWPACHSALRLDRWMAGELPRGDAEALEAHVAGCARCREAVDAMQEARDRTALPPLRPAPARRGRSLGFGAVGAAALAAAAGLVVVLRPVDPPLRAKGGEAPVLSMYVRHEDVVRRAGADEVVARGDAIRFAVSLHRPAYVAVLSRDPAGRASVYYPTGPRAEPVQAGAEVALPVATRLDDSAGREEVFGLFCDQPVEVEPLRARLDALASGFVPPGCQVTRWSFEKR